MATKQFLNQNPKNPDKKENSIKSFLIHNLKRIRKQKPFTLFVLFGVTLSFAALGIGNYVRTSSSTDVVVTVGEQQLPVTLLEREIERFVNYAKTKDQNLSDDELRSEAVVRQRLMEMIQAQLLSQYIRDQHLVPSDAKLASIIAAQPEFQINGSFAKDLYLQNIRQSRVSLDDFEENFRMTVARDNLLPFLLNTSFLPEGSVNAWQKIISETREILPHTIVGEKFSSQIQISQQEKNDYYQQYKTEYFDPTKVKVKFVEFSPLTLRANIDLDQTELKQFYQNNKTTLFSANKEYRNARHILVSLDENASDQDKIKAEANIKDLLTKVKADPSIFAELATVYSQDPGSKERGGLYENIQPGTMVAEFDQALFNLKEGEVSDIVKTQFGYHIIKLEKIISESNKDFEDVRGEVEATYLEEESNKMFNALVENFKSIIDEQIDNPDVINLAAKEFELQVIESDWIDINNQKIPLNNPVVLNAIFSNDGLAQKVVRVNLQKENKVLALVVTDIIDKKQLTFEQAEEEITEQLKQNKTSELIDKELEQKMAALNSGKDDLLWEAPINLNRIQPQIPQYIVSKIFSQPSNKIPSYVDIKLSSDKSIIYKINQIDFDREFSNDLLQTSEELFTQYWQSRIINGIFAYLVEKYPVIINEEVLAKTYSK